MSLATPLSAPVDTYFRREERRYGFLHPPKGSQAARLTQGQDILLHLDALFLPVITAGGVEFGTETPTPKEIEKAETFLKRGKEIAFELQRTTKGFRAQKWCPKPFWDDAVLEWTRLYSQPSTQPHTEIKGASR